VGRIAGLIIIVGATVFSLLLYDVFEQFLVAIEVTIVFAAPFWIGMYWRRATRWAAWGTVVFSSLLFFVIPPLLPALFPGLRTNPIWTDTNLRVTTVVHRECMYVDHAKREAQRELWREDYESALEIEDAEERQAALDKIGEIPAPYPLGEKFIEKHDTGGKPVFWTGKAAALGEESAQEKSSETTGSVSTVVERRVGKFKCEGWFNADFLIYRAFNVDLTQLSDPVLDTLRLPTRIIIPFLVMILLSLITPRNSARALDRYYAKMKTPVNPDPEVDKRQLEQSMADPQLLEHKKLVPGTSLEMQRPTLVDAVGFVVCFIICFLFIGVAILVASIGG
jgi:hypothetical protein